MKNKNLFLIAMMVSASGCQSDIASIGGTTTILSSGDSIVVHTSTPTPTPIPVSVSPTHLTHAVVTTLAGTRPGSDGSAAAATYTGPYGIVSDANGGFLVSDSGINTIRKVAADGSVTTLAGTPYSNTSVDGTGSAAHFRQPSGIARDPTTGNYYISDSNVIRMMTPTGVVTTLAGNTSVYGFADGLGSAAQFNTVIGLAVDRLGNVYVADYGNQAIRKITPAGLVSTLAGMGPTYHGYVDGPGATANFFNPYGVAVDASLNVYVADATNCVIRKIANDVNATVSTIAGVQGACTFADGIGTAARLNTPYSMSMGADGKLYFSEYTSLRIRSYSLIDGTVSTLAGNGTQGVQNGSSASFASPIAVAEDATGNIFVADYGAADIRVINGVTHSVSNFSSGPNLYYSGGTNGPAAQSNFYNPRGMVSDQAGNLYIADSQNYKIRKITPQGIVSTYAGSTYGAADGPISTATFGQLTGLAIDSAQNIYAADSTNRVVRMITPQGVVSTIAGTGVYGTTNGAGSSATFGNMGGIAIDPSGNLFVTDPDNNLIRKITPSRVVSTFAGTPVRTYAPVHGGSYSYQTISPFSDPEGIAVDIYGYVYVADAGNNVIEEITPDGALVSVLAGTKYTSGFADGTGTAAKFSNPSGVAVDQYGTVYVTDTYNYSVRSVTYDGVVTTFAGNINVSASVDGSFASATFANPISILLGSSGLLYITDQNYIREVQP